MGANLPILDFGSGRSATQLRTHSQRSTCALLDDASVKCWGKGEGGRLGYEDTLNRGQSPCTMGDKLPAVDLGTAFTPAKLASSYRNICVISTTGTVKCWGLGTNGETGYEDLQSRGDSPGTMGNALPVVNMGDGLQVFEGAGGHSRMCYLFTTEQVKCLGNSSVLGYGDSTGRYTNLADDLPFLDFGSRN
eukprot:63283-Amphidinium_carterae.1